MAQRVDGNRRLSAAERRELILAAATEVFAEHGYEAASMGEIASRAGVVASVIYDHFPSKRELHIELIQLHGEALLQRSIAEIEAPTPEAIQRASLEVYYRMVEEDPFAWRFLFRDPPSDPAIAAAHREIHERATAGIAGLVRAGAPDIEEFAGIPAETAIWMVAKAAQSTANGLAQWWWEHREVSREQVVEFAHALIWTGVERLLEDARAGAGVSRTAAAPPE